MAHVKKISLENKNITRKLKNITRKFQCINFSLFKFLKLKANTQFHPVQRSLAMYDSNSTKCISAQEKRLRIF